MKNANTFGARKRRQGNTPKHGFGTLPKNKANKHRLHPAPKSHLFYLGDMLKPANRIDVSLQGTVKQAKKFYGLDNCFDGNGGPNTWMPG